MKWTVKFRNKNKLFKVIKTLRPSSRRKLYAAIKDLELEGPAPKVWDSKRMEGQLRDYWRLKIDYRHRLIFEVFHGILIIEIIEVTTREGAYKK